MNSREKPKDNTPRISRKYYTIINPLIQAPGLKKFRGLNRVNRDKILDRKPIEEWWIN